MVPLRERLTGPAGIALGVLLVVSFLYSVLLVQQVLVWFLLVAVFGFLYLLLLFLDLFVRFVEAVERIADASERLASGERPTTDAPTAATPDRSTTGRTDDRDA